MCSRHLYIILIAAVFLSIMNFLTGCSNQQPPEEPVKKEVLIYCGMTMVQPVRKIADLIEEKENCIIKIIKNGSNSLYRSIKVNQQGDLYLPGSDSYIIKCLEEKLVVETVLVGFNKAAMIVAKNNPLNITSDLHNFLNPDYRVVLGAPDSGAIGKETKRILSQAGIYDQVLKNALYLTTDSKYLSRAIIDNKADIIINWRATVMWPENKNKMDVFLLDKKISLPKKLVLGLLNCSSQPEIARRFMELASSTEGQNIFTDYGFGE